MVTNNSLNNTCSNSFSVTGGNLTVTRASTGDIYSSVSNTNVSSAANAALTAQAANGGGDAFWSMSDSSFIFTGGVDQSDSHKFKMGFQGNPSAGTESIVFTTSGEVTVPRGDLAVTRTLAGGGPEFVLSNADTTNPLSSARQVISTGDGGGDTYTLLSAGSGSGKSFEYGIQQSTNTFQIQSSPGNGSPNMDGTTIFKATQSGSITKPLQPSFLAVLTVSATNTTGNGADYVLSTASGGTLTEVFDQSNSFAPATGIFTAPVTGKYYFKVRFLINSITVAMTGASCTIVGTSRTFQGGVINAGAVKDVSNNLGIEASCFIDMTAGDTASAHLSLSGGAGDSAGVSGGVATSPVSWFEGFLVA